eukprot:Seg3325.2 transcript_id=Seg3325.2/GoldUCD/mRNA.D3Y31 product="hypothetical protein" protein_id=Seg3325.2/GoldUCD/D3Y31
MANWVLRPWLEDFLLKGKHSVEITTSRKCQIVQTIDAPDEEREGNICALVSDKQLFIKAIFTRDSLEDYSRRFPGSSLKDLEGFKISLTKYSIIPKLDCDQNQCEFELHIYGFDSPGGIKSIPFDGTIAHASKHDPIEAKLRYLWREKHIRKLSHIIFVKKLPHLKRCCKKIRSEDQELIDEIPEWREDFVPPSSFETDEPESPSIDQQSFQLPDSISADFISSAYILSLEPAEEIMGESLSVPTTEEQRHSLIPSSDQQNLSNASFREDNERRICSSPENNFENNSPLPGANIFDFVPASEAENFARSLFDDQSAVSSVEQASENQIERGSLSPCFDIIHKKSGTENSSPSANTNSILDSTKKSETLCEETNVDGKGMPEKKSEENVADNLAVSENNVDKGAEISRSDFHTASVSYNQNMQGKSICGGIEQKRKAGHSAARAIYFPKEPLTYTHSYSTQGSKKRPVNACDDVVKSKKRKIELVKEITTDEADAEYHYIEQSQGFTVDESQIETFGLRIPKALQGFASKTSAMLTDASHYKAMTDSTDAVMIKESSKGNNSENNSTTTDASRNEAMTDSTDAVMIKESNKGNNSENSSTTTDASCNQATSNTSHAGIIKESNKGNTPENDSIMVDASRNEAMTDTNDAVTIKESNKSEENNSITIDTSRNDAIIDTSDATIIKECEKGGTLKKNAMLIDPSDTKAIMDISNAEMTKESKKGNSSGEGNGSFFISQSQDEEMADHDSGTKESKENGKGEDSCDKNESFSVSQSQDIEMTDHQSETPKECKRGDESVKQPLPGLVNSIPTTDRVFGVTTHQEDTSILDFAKVTFRRPTIPKGAEPRISKEDQVMDSKKTKILQGQEKSVAIANDHLNGGDNKVAENIVSDSSKDVREITIETIAQSQQISDEKTQEAESKKVKNQQKKNAEINREADSQNENKYQTVSTEVTVVSDRTVGNISPEHPSEEEESAKEFTEKNENLPNVNDDDVNQRSDVATKDQLVCKNAALVPRDAVRIDLSIADGKIDICAEPESQNSVAKKSAVDINANIESDSKPANELISKDADVDLTAELKDKASESRNCVVELQGNTKSGTPGFETTIKLNPIVELPSQYTIVQEDVTIVLSNPCNAESQEISSVTELIECMAYSPKQKTQEHHTSPSPQEQEELSQCPREQSQYSQSQYSQSQYSQSQYSQSQYSQSQFSQSQYSQSQYSQSQHSQSQRVPDASILIPREPPFQGPGHRKRADNSHSTPTPGHRKRADNSHSTPTLTQLAGCFDNSGLTQLSQLEPKSSSTQVPQPDVKLHEEAQSVYVDLEAIVKAKKESDKSITTKGECTGDKITVRPVKVIPDMVANGDCASDELPVRLIKDVQNSSSSNTNSSGTKSGSESILKPLNPNKGGISRSEPEGDLSQIAPSATQLAGCLVVSQTDPNSQRSTNTSSSGTKSGSESILKPLNPNKDGISRSEPEGDLSQIAPSATQLAGCLVVSQTDPNSQRSTNTSSSGTKSGSESILKPLNPDKDGISRSEPEGDLSQIAPSATQLARCLAVSQTDPSSQPSKILADDTMHRGMSAMGRNSSQPFNSQNTPSTTQFAKCIIDPQNDLDSQRSKIFTDDTMHLDLNINETEASQVSKSQNTHSDSQQVLALVGQTLVHSPLNSMPDSARLSSESTSINLNSKEQIIHDNERQAREIERQIKEIERQTKEIERHTKEIKRTSKEYLVGNAASSRSIFRPPLPKDKSPPNTQGTQGIQSLTQLADCLVRSQVAAASQLTGPAKKEKFVLSQIGTQSVYVDLEAIVKRARARDNGREKKGRGMKNIRGNEEQVGKKGSEIEDKGETRKNNKQIDSGLTEKNLQCVGTSKVEKNFISKKSNQKKPSSNDNKTLEKDIEKADPSSYTSLTPISLSSIEADDVIGLSKIGVDSSRSKTSDSSYEESLSIFKASSHEDSSGDNRYSIIGGLHPILKFSSSSSSSTSSSDGPDKHGQPTPSRLLDQAHLRKSTTMQNEEPHVPFQVTAIEICDSQSQSQGTEYFSAAESLDLDDQPNPSKRKREPEYMEIDAVPKKISKTCDSLSFSPKAKKVSFGDIRAWASKGQSTKITSHSHTNKDMAEQFNQKPKNNGTVFNSYENKTAWTSTAREEERQQQLERKWPSDEVQKSIMKFWEKVKTEQKGTGDLLSVFKRFHPKTFDR